MDPAAAQQVCDGAVCVTALHEPQLAQIKGPVGNALRKLARLPNAPTRAEELVRDMDLDDVVEPRSGSTLYISLDELTLKAAELELLLLRGAGTPRCPDPQAGNSDADAWERVTAARHLAGVWLVGGTDPTATLIMPYGRERVEALIRPAWDALMKAPEDEQRARVAALRDSGLACDGRDLLAILADGTGAGR